MPKHLVVTTIPALFVVACAGRPPVAAASTATPEPEPGWVNGDCRDFVRETELCAVGLASGIHDPSLRRRQAQLMGRTEFLRSIKQSARAVDSNFSQTGRAPLALSQVSAAVEGTVQGMRTMLYWERDDGATGYALMTISRELLRSALQRQASADEGRTAELLGYIEQLIEQQRNN